MLSRIHVRMLPALLSVVAVSVSSCGGSPTDPDQELVNGCFAIVGNRGTVTASISGLPGFSGVVPTGSATFTPPTSVTPGLFIVQGTDVSTGTSVLVGGPAVLGPTTASLLTLNGSAVQIMVTTRSCTAATGLWIGNLVFGTATVNVTSVSASGVGGAFNGTLDASPGSGAVGSKSISGTFTATF